MRRSTAIGIGIVLAAATAVAGFRLWRGPSGASRDYGGELEARSVPDFPSLAGERWANGAPTSLASLRGNVIVVEAWHPT
jgi:hypothetical protein